MSHKLGICIPYRNRKEHVERLIPHLSKYLIDNGIDVLPAVFISNPINKVPLLLASYSLED